MHELEELYERQAMGHSEDGVQGWLNWIIRRRDSTRAIGFVQATLTCTDGDLVADVAWVVGPTHQGLGLATEAAMAMCGWPHSRGVGLLVAYVSSGNYASIGVARHLGMYPTGEVVEGEERWERSVSCVA